ncbi:MAG: hypothetical protein IJK42_07235 [Prevotella sp.]|nr:hypothetical protein [Prevotella sp.]MBQ6209549.1 hypothetical protein [Prevotella sp.]
MNKKKMYQSPRTRVIDINGQRDLLDIDIPLGSQKVSNESDIGFAKRGTTFDDMPDTKAYFWDF